MYDFDGEGQDYIDVTARVISMTARAALLEVNGDRRWVPKSLIDDPDSLEEGEEVTIGIEEWKLEELGW
ncbi:MAG: hypothetical protein ACM3ZC_13585 [Bacteroidota bacterium]